MWNILKNTGETVLHSRWNTEFGINSEKLLNSFYRATASVVTTKLSRRKGRRSLYLLNEKKHFSITSLDTRLSRRIFKKLS